MSVSTCRCVCAGTCVCVRRGWCGVCSRVWGGAGVWLGARAYAQLVSGDSCVLLRNGSSRQRHPNPGLPVLLGHLMPIEGHGWSCLAGHLCLPPWPILGPSSQLSLTLRESGGQAQATARGLRLSPGVSGACPRGLGCTCGSLGWRPGPRTLTSRGWHCRHLSPLPQPRVVCVQPDLSE